MAETAVAVQQLVIATAAFRGGGSGADHWRWRVAPAMCRQPQVAEVIAMKGAYFSDGTADYMARRGTDVVVAVAWFVGVDFELASTSTFESVVELSQSCAVSSITATILLPSRRIAAHL